MSCTKMFETLGVAVSGTAIKVLPHNVHRKALFLAASGGDVKVAVGYTPATTSYFTIKDGAHVTFDSFIPIGEIWASGTGTLVYGEAV
ncbi:hypothetical protein tf_61 [Pseudomonas phage tf]|uniref:Uncharacterized protein n=1 Tax=Pseudomonas phage tf TaxID=1114179 RepID=I2FLT0_9CAUD|nr:hypothetical protein tf_61 [Pseudomonas phage tf]CCE60814.1 hypothetical protein tf_61 [Pseudomonas phage tf]